MDVVLVSTPISLGELALSTEKCFSKDEKIVHNIESKDYRQKK